MCLSATMESMQTVEADHPCFTIVVPVLGFCIIKFVLKMILCKDLYSFLCLSIIARCQKRAETAKAMHMVEDGLSQHMVEDGLSQQMVEVGLSEQIVEDGLSQQMAEDGLSQPQF